MKYENFQHNNADMITHKKEYSLQVKYSHVNTSIHINTSMDVE